ncbi:hypothetical protein [Streptomyces cavernicola]|uniref:Uncharacterized protein n=1 Tax=Streptomyces cavernicola TaxID=3043613 RepID=A0ABT6SDC9_9ACTN|nr:hypothetical protein [Streptomyces sp. B-S-A6]MDI3406201.1 hypothetical protein [Streptomyces sp. B-S-A6]
MTERTPQEGEARPSPVTRDRNPLEYWARAAVAPEAPRAAATPAAPPASPAAAEAQEHLLDAITRATRALDVAEPGAPAELERLARAYALATSRYAGG